VPFDELKQQFATCRALVFPGEEDFGIVPVEVMACGRPVIAYGRGGALDTVVEGISGILFYDQSVSALNAAIDRFEETPELVADPDTIRTLAKSFDVDVFKDKFAALAARALATSKAGSAAAPSQE
jgi:glycosyltransferase involved in cell wall biosynthesis